ncbi:hypothetical protein EVAR_64676_1 [Eumeta japonica]|uniref:Phospholipase A2-like domain-containing protein n=1 Tax=Eumeta variegata TaxID=151549 RepID=A0A4C1SW63_EUMVA|nr:hypothetical protein EVAR_64676_1 [Eumeta japonica]
MVVLYNKAFSLPKTTVGEGLLDKTINSLPFELHLPGYQYCGPGTKLQKRLKQGDQGINSLDAACKNHDIVYSKNKDLNIRHQADKVLENKAWERVVSKDSSLAEKSFAYLVTNAMKLKQKFGMGVEKKKRRKMKKFFKWEKTF